MITICQGDISLINTRLTKSAIYFGGRRNITTPKFGATASKNVNGVNHRIVGPSYLQVTYPLIAHSNVFQIQNGSVSPIGLECSYALTIIDDFTRFAALIALPDKKEQTIAKALVERVFSNFGPPEALHSDQGPEFKNIVVKQLQDVFGYKKTKTTPYRPQGNSVSERMLSTLHVMLSMYSNIARNNWAEVLPFIQLAHNTSYSTTMHVAPFLSMFGRQEILPIDMIFVIPHVGRSTTTEQFTHSTRENLQIAIEIARRNLSERIDKQKTNSSKLPPIPEFTPG